MKKIYDYGSRKVWETTTNKGNKFIVEIGTTVHDPKFKKGVMNIWVKEGYVKKFMEKTLHVHTHYEFKNGDSYHWYNPQVIYDDKGRRKLNFDYLLEATEENEMFLLNEAIKLANQSER